LQMPPPPLSALSGLGLVLGLVSLALLGSLAPRGEAAFSSGAAFLFGGEYFLNTLGLMLFIPIMATLLCVWTARWTLLGALAR